MPDHAIPGRRAVAEAVRSGRRLRKVVVEDRSRLRELVQAVAERNVPVRTASRDELDDLAGGVTHQGVVAVAPPFPYRHLSDVVDTRLLVLLDGVTDPQNLGAIARSAEAAGAGGLILPRRRSVQVTSAAEKAAAGAFSWLPVALTPNIAQALAELAAGGFWSIGLDEGGEEDLWSCGLLDARVALVVGAEGRGLSRLAAERVDARVTIPMCGRLASLNAAAAATVALFEVVRRRTADLPG